MGFGENEAIIFFDRDQVVKEMLYAEFEAILDQFVGVPDFANQQVHSVYLRINDRLQVTASVSFLISFDGEGFADKNWNIRLQHLADTGGRGPDLGDGLIRLSCRSQCSVSWHQRDLWDPQLESANNSFKAIEAAVKRNRLALEYNDLPSHSQFQNHEPAPQFTSTAPSAGDQGSFFQQSLDAQVEQRLKEEVEVVRREYKLRIETMKAGAQEYLDKLHHHYRGEQKKVNETLDATKHMFKEEKHKNLRLKKTLESQAEDMHETREKYQQQLQSAKDVDKEQLKKLAENFELEKKASIDTVTAELKEMLDMREVELFYREEQLTGLREEVAELRQKSLSMTGQGGD